jgi:hypothetical protein
VSAISKQEVFDIVAKHLLVQNAKSVRALGPHRTLHSAYHSVDGKKCAIGCLIDVSEYTIEMEGSADPYDVIPERYRAHSSLLIALQGIHDTRAPERWAYALRMLAKDEGLVMPGGAP